MQIDQPGDMLIYMSHSNNRDIDFACWGPFTGYSTYGELLQAVCTSQLTGGAGTHRPTNGYHDPNNPSTWGGYPSGMMIDCSYSAASTEWCFIPNAQVGQWYIFLICNYSRASDFNVERADYLCLRDVSLYYDLPEAVAKWFHMKRFTVGVTGNTLHYFTRVSGAISPETGMATGSSDSMYSSTNNANSNGNLVPSTRKVLFNVKLTF